MPDIPVRRAKERRVKEALRKCRGERRERLVEMLGDPADLSKVPPEFWDELRECEENSLIPLLLAAYIGGAVRLRNDAEKKGVETLTADDLVTRGERWARSRAKEFAKGAVKNTKKRIRDQIRKAKKGELDESVGDAVRKIVSSPSRIEISGATETTEAHNAGENDIVEKAKEQASVDVEIRWVTEHDPKVCFPADTLVLTEYGEIPIQDIQIGTRVKTRNGFREVLATAARDYLGSMTSLLTDVGAVTSTSDHPIFSKERWVCSGNLRPGDRLDSFLQEKVKVRGALNFDIGNTKYTDSRLVECGSFSLIAFGVSVPVDSVYFQCDLCFNQEEINRISPEAVLLNKLDPHFGECDADKFFRDSLSIELSVTREAAELPVFIARQFSESLSTIAAVDFHRRASAYLRAVFSSSTPRRFAGKFLPASFAGDNFSIERFSFAGQRAEIEPTGGAGGDAELFLASCTGFSNLSPLFAALRRTEDFGRSARGEVESGSTFGACFIDARSFALRGGELHLPVTFGHDSIPVYDIQVDGEPEFYANGILVHNCPICRPLHMKPESVWAEQFPTGPPAHPGCRCWTRVFIDNTSTGSSI